MTALLEIERQASTGETRQTSPFDVGRWCFANDAECPYTADHDVSEWYRGWLDASAQAIEWAAIR